MNYQAKLEKITELERQGLLRQIAIYAFRCDCPFCFAQASFYIQLRSQANAPTYACAICGEVGSLIDLKDNLKFMEHPERVTVRRGRKVSQRELVK